MHILFVIVEFAIVLGIMVLVHEFGHFIVAKLCGVRVERFSIGFPPRLFGFKYGDTDYCISAIPLGGYVKMAGDTPGSEPEEGSWNTDEFNAHPRWQRMLIALAGPCANFLLSFFLLTLVAHNHHEVDKYLEGPAVVDYVPVNTPAAHLGIAPGDTILNFDNVANPNWNQIVDECALNLNRSVPITFLHSGQPISGTILISVKDPGAATSPLDILEPAGILPREQSGPISVTDVSSGTPAERAGLQPNDLITRVDSLQPHSVPTMLAYLKDRNGAPATLYIQRNGQPLILNATPEKTDIGGDNQFRLGFSYMPPPTTVERLPIGASIKQSLKDNKEDSSLILRVLKGMFTRHVSVKSLSGPVGIAQQIDLATRLGIWTLFRLMSTISLNLGIFNLLPLPILDGGMLIFLIVESIMRRDVNVEIKERVYQVAFICFILFAVFVLFNDVTKLHLGH